MNPLDWLLNFLMQNVFYIVIIGVAIYFLAMYLKVKSKTKYKIIDRRVIEKANFIEEMRYNIADKFKWLFKGKQLIGKITHYVEVTKDVKGMSPVTTVKMVFKPTFRSRILPFAKPFSRAEALMIEDDSLTAKDQQRLNSQILDVEEKIKIREEEMEQEKDKEKIKIMEKSVKTLKAMLIDFKKKATPLIVKNEDRHHFTINSDRGLDYYFGIYFDMKTPSLHSDNIINTRVLKTDVEQLASRYFTKSQQECVYDPVFAKEFALKEREIALEMAKAKGKRESV